VHFRGADIAYLMETMDSAGGDLSGRLGALLTEYFNNDDLFGKGLPTVGYLGERLCVSPKCLSSLTGQSALQHIHDILIKKAKELLSVSQLSVGEIAYMLGYEHPQSFSKFLKVKRMCHPRIPPFIL